jgi:DNA-binding LacI/PurR family transcriptional regulator
LADAPAGIKEVAAHAGVSVGTVPNVPNRPDIVAGPTRSRVRAAIKQPGFIRNESARQLRAGRSRTIGVLQEMTAQRIRVPESISLIGYDDIYFAAAAAVPLSSVRQPRQLPGRTAAQLLLDEALGDGAHQHRQVVFEPELVVRQSSQARPRGARRSRRPGQNDGVPGTGPAARNQAG